MTRPEAPAVVASYFDAVNSKEWETLGRLFTEDAEIRPVGSRPRVGRDDVIDHYPRTLAHFVQYEERVNRVHVAGDVVTVEIRFTGRARDGADIVFDAVDVFDLEDGRIRRLSMWYDTADVARQAAGGGSY